MSAIFITDKINDTESHVQYRSIEVSDWNQVNRIQHEAYEPFLQEDLSVLKQKVDLSPSTCTVVENETGHIIGYSLMHPYQLGLTPPINQVIELSLQANSTNLFIHDFALEINSQSKGIARELFLFQKKKAEMLGYQSLSVVAVQNSMNFWLKMGFIIQYHDSLESYGSDVTYMLMDLNIAE